ncbi:actin-related protein 8-like isoform X2 [Abrus precatorius]|uniref:Actin-related protein 8-like isoform X2 n=1 Tax=Abrus precatorius TaxID=3816 RepID=A0A8B8KQI7_ABRPR|nr:actin-related protein 8-like isoform X2 [Abrus precatorius]
MATLLRKLCETASLKRSSSNSSTNTSSSSPLGAFDPLPADILAQIVLLLGPKHAAILCVVCKSWRSLVSNNAFWIQFLQTHHPHASLFAETTLSSGYPLPILVAHNLPRVSFQHVYAQRERLPASVIIDGGSGYCKFGWSKDAAPSGRFATFLEFGNVETPMYSRLRHFFTTIYSRMQVKPSSQPAVVSIPICHYDDTESAKASRQQLKEAIYSALFDMNVPAVCALNQGTLALYAAKQTSGIAVNIGFQVTSVVPIFNGKVMRKVGVEVVGLGALKLTGFLREQMQLNNISFESLYTVRTLKELCYVAVDYEAELLKDTQASFEAVEGLFTLSKERFLTGEILFQPRLAGVRAMGLHQAIALCMDHCYSAELAADNDWYKTVVLSGGTACLPGLAERLEKELHSLLPPCVSSGIRVIPPPFGVDTAWFGGKIIGSLSTFPGPWCTTKKQFRQKSKLDRIW